MGVIALTDGKAGEREIGCEAACNFDPSTSAAIARSNLCNRHSPQGVSSQIVPIPLTFRPDRRPYRLTRSCDRRRM
jgi:hypothetical protein